MTSKTVLRKGRGWEFRWGRIVVGVDEVRRG
jgi:hypothetical protein